MEKFSLSEVVEQAVQTERLGYKFYTGVAMRFKDEGGLKELFETLAAKELVHEKRFSELKDAVKDEEPEAWDEVSKYLRAIVESAFFLGSDKALSSIANISDVRDAVRTAIGFEKETLLYFYAIRDVIKEKDILGKIIEEEKSHILWLGKFENSLKSPK